MCMKWYYSSTWPFIFCEKVLGAGEGSMGGVKNPSSLNNITIAPSVSVIIVVSSNNACHTLSSSSFEFNLAEMPSNASERWLCSLA